MLGFSAFRGGSALFCPSCRDEYRPGFTRCATCGVDLVESLEPTAAGAPAARPDERSAIAPEPTAPYCGFLSLAEARDAKSRMREAGFHAEILIRDGEGPDGQEIEEYWLLLPPRAFRAAQGIVGFDAAEAEAGEVLCSVCDKPVPEDADACPHCGARFEEN